MKLFGVPGVNGLGMTSGVENSPKKLCSGMEFSFLDLDIGDVSKQLEDIHSFADNCFKEEKCFFVGGDHSISYPIVKAFFERFGKESKLLVFDAHPDLMKPMPEPTHEEWLRGIYELGFKQENILIVGIRKNSENVDKKEISFAKKNKIKLIYSEDFEKQKEEISNFVAEGKVYLSFDMDVFDSSIISSTGYPEKDGLNESQIFSLLEKIKNKVYSGDLVEVNLGKGSKKARENAILISRKILKTLGL